MNLYLRLLLTWLRNRHQPLRHYLHVATSRFRVLPHDLDVFGHMNNGRYLQVMDVARVEWMIQTGVASVIRANRWAPILGGGTVRFMRSLRLFDRYEVNTRLLGWDRRWFYLEHSFIDGRGRSAAVGVTRAGLRQRDGWVDACTVANAVHPGAISPEIPGHIHDWVDFEEAICLHSTGQFRPGKADIALREIN